jgi:guanylate kinase
MLTEMRPAEKVGLDWAYSCDSRFQAVAKRGDDLPEHVKETISSLVTNTPRHRIEETLQSGFDPLSQSFLDITRDY